MSPTTTAEPPVPLDADPRRLALDLERLVRPLPAAERRAVLARLVALAAEPDAGPEANGHPPPPPDRPVEELIAVEKEYPPPAWEEMLPDARWAQDRISTPAFDPYVGSHVFVYNEAVVGHGNDTIRLHIELARKYNVHPNRFVVIYVDPPGVF